MSQLGKLYNIGFVLNATQGRGFDAAFSKAQQEFTRLGKEIQGLNKIQSDISAWEKQSAAIEKTRAKLDNLRQQETLLTTQIEAAKKAEEQDTAAIAGLEREKLKLQQQIGNTEAALERQNQKLDATGERLKKADVDTKNLTEASAKLTTQLEDLHKQQDEAAKGAQTLGEKISGSFDAAAQTLAAAGITAMLDEVYQALWACADASMAFETAMAGVRRTVGGSEAEIAGLGEYFQEMPTRIPITTSELAKIAETAGQLGIARDSVEEFTEVMAMLGTATDLSADTAATMLAQFANITGVTDYRRLGSAVAELGDATATTASKVVEMSQGMAAAAHLAGMSETDILGIAAAVGSLGIESQAGSTAMSTLIQTLYKAVETGDDLEDFASVAGMSAAEFRTAWGEDAVGALDAFIRGLNDTERNGQSAIVILEELGITNVRQTKAILGLASAGVLLSGTITQANAAWEQNTALQEKASVMYGTTESKLTMMQNAWDNLKVAIGDNYTPVLENAYELGTDVLGGLTQFVQENPALVKAVTTFTTVAGGAAVAITAVSAAVKVLRTLDLGSLFTGPVGMIALAVTGVATAVTALSGAEEEMLDASWELTSVSRDQYNQLQELNAEYEKLCANGEQYSDEAYSLKWRIEDLTAEFEAGRQTMEEYTAAQDAMKSNYREMVSSHEAAAAKIDDEEANARALISKLEELSGSSEDAARNQEAILAIINRLNEAMPELALSYDGLISGPEAFVAALREEAEATKQAKQLAEDYAAYTDALGQKDELKARIESAATKVLKGQEEYWERKKALEAAKYWDFPSGIVNCEVVWLHTLQAEFDAAKEQLDVYIADLADATADWEENDARIAELEGTFGDYTEEQLAYAASLEGVLGSAGAQLDQLSEKYQEVYEAAKESFEGQFGLFDMAQADVDATLANAQKALDSQLAYWQNYGANIETLRAISAEDLGVTQENYEALMAYVRSGTPEAAGLAADMVRAVNDGATETIANAANTLGKIKEYQEQAEHDVSAWTLGLTEQMDQLIEDMRESVEALDMSDVAEDSAQSIIQAFINKAGKMEEFVQGAYARLGQVAAESLGQDLSNLHYGWHTLDLWKFGGHASGTDNAPPGWAWVGEEGPELMRFHGGEQVIPAEASREFAALSERYGDVFPGYAAGTGDAARLVEMANFLPYNANGFLPYSGAAEAARETAGFAFEADALPAPESGSPPVQINLEMHLHIEAGAPPETVDAWQDYVNSGELDEHILEVTEAAAEDLRRRLLV